MQNVLIHMTESALDHIKELGLYYVCGNGEYDVTVTDVDYDPDHYLADPDEQLYDYYGIDYDQVNCIEAA